MAILAYGGLAILILNLLASLLDTAAVPVPHTGRLRHIASHPFNK